MDSSVISLNIPVKNSFRVYTPENIQDPFKTMFEVIKLRRRRGRRAGGGGGGGNNSSSSTSRWVWGNFQ